MSKKRVGISVVLYVAAVGFCVLGLIGHSAAWAAATMSFFAATMMMVGRQKDKRAKTEIKDHIRRNPHDIRGNWKKGKGKCGGFRGVRRTAKE